jgi:hypothetical protein
LRPFLKYIACLLSRYLPYFQSKWSWTLKGWPVNLCRIYLSLPQFFRTEIHKVLCEKSRKSSVKKWVDQV